MPVKVHCHQLNILEGKLILTGGRISDTQKETNQVWEGAVTVREGVVTCNPVLSIKWTLLPRMRKKRKGHVAFVIDDAIYCVEGDKLSCTEYFSYKTNLWQKGPKLPFPLFMAKGVVDLSTKRHILIGGFGEKYKGYNGKIGVFDRQKGFVEIGEELECARIYHFASLL